MGYKALVAKAHLSPHPNADKLKLVNINGYQVVTGANLQEGQLVVFFPEGGQLSHEFVFENSEYRAGKGTNKDPEKTGLFEANRRVKTIRLRGQASEGYCVPVENLAFVGSLKGLTEGTTFTEINGHVICEKYIPQATREAIANRTKGDRQVFTVEGFEKHFDTEQLRLFINRIPEGAILYFTEKLHGTSGRTGYVKAPTELTKWQSRWNDFWHSFSGLVTRLWSLLYIIGIQPKLFKPLLTWQTISGSRNVTYRPGRSYGDSYREQAESLFRDKLLKGETIFYEIVGYTESGNPLFSHGLGDRKDKDDVCGGLRKTYDTDRMEYSYGSEPKEHRVFVYRITMTNEDGEVTELPWSQVKARCAQLGVQRVPQIGEPLVYGYMHQIAVWCDACGQLEGKDSQKEILLELAKVYSGGVSTLDKRHIREGICLRVEHPEVPPERSILKYKGFEFCHLEGIAKNDDKYVDVEEVS